MSMKKNLNVQSVLMRGNCLAEVFESESVTEQSYMEMLDYSSEVLLAKNSDELLDAMHCDLREMSIETERQDKLSVIAAFMAKHNTALWEAFCADLAEIMNGEIEVDPCSVYTELNLVSGYNLYFSSLDKEKVEAIADVLIEGGMEMQAKTIAADEIGDEWRITYMFNESKAYEDDAFVDAVNVVREIGMALAHGMGCNYNGSEVYVNEAAVKVGHAAGMYVH